MSQDVAGYLENNRSGLASRRLSGAARDHPSRHSGGDGAATVWQAVLPQRGEVCLRARTAKGWVSFTILNAAALDAPDGLFEPGSAERKTIKIRQGQEVDYELLAVLVQLAASTL